MHDLPRQKLSELVAEYGHGLCDDAKRLEGMLKDVLRNEHKREMFVLVTRCVWVGNNRLNCPSIPQTRPCVRWGTWRQSDLTREPTVCGANRPRLGKMAEGRRSEILHSTLEVIAQALAFAALRAYQASL